MRGSPPGIDAEERVAEREGNVWGLRDGGEGGVRSVRRRGRRSEVR